MAYNPLADTSLFSQTADQIITNTVAETSALGAGIGSQTIKANSLTPGKRLRLHGEGIYNAPVLPSSITIKVKLGSTVVASVTTTALLASASGKAFSFDCLVVFRTVGANGTCVAGGSLSYSVGTSKIFEDIDNAGQVVNIDTTQDMLVDVTDKWDAATTTRLVKTTIATIMLV